MILAVGLYDSYGMNSIQLKAIKAKKDITPTLKRLGELQQYITKTF